MAKQLEDGISMVEENKQKSVVSSQGSEVVTAEKKPVIARSAEAPGLIRGTKQSMLIIFWIASKSKISRNDGSLLLRAHSTLRNSPDFKSPRT